MQTRQSTKYFHLATWTTLATLATACQTDDGDAPESFRSAISARSVISEATLSGVRYELTPVDCGSGMAIGPTESIDRPYEDQMIPGNIPEQQNNPLDEGSSHAFADLFQVVEPGCWDVMATPLDENGNPSEVCAAAWKKGVIVNEGETTEVFLLNQCEGDDPGAIDVIAALNHEPDIDDVRFAESKFVCGATEEVCATAHDEDADPLELVLEFAADAPCEATPLGEPTGDPGVAVNQCWEISCNEPGRHDFDIRVYDLVWRDGMLVRIEDWLAEEGYPNESHGELSLYAYFDGTKYWPDADGDGFGDPNSEPVLVCTDDDPPDGTVPNDDDCDDTNAGVNPDAEEVCDDGIDNDCDGAIDEDCGGCAEGRDCGTYIFGECDDCNMAGGVCVKTAEGGALCHIGVSCAGLPDCTTSADCAPDARCIVDTCCGRPVCIAEPNICIEGVDADGLVSSTETPSTVAG